MAIELKSCSARFGDTNWGDYTLLICLLAKAILVNFCVGVSFLRLVPFVFHLCWLLLHPSSFRLYFLFNFIV